MKALIVMDLQKGGLSQPQFGREEIIERINGLARWIRHQGGVVIFVQQDGPQSVAPLPGAPEFGLIPELERDEADLLLVTTMGSAFYQTNLEGVLRSRGIRVLYVAGFATQHCLHTTLLAALERAFHVVMVSDGHTASVDPFSKTNQIVDYYNGLWARLKPDVGSVEVLTTGEITKVRNFPEGLARVREPISR